MRAILQLKTITELKKMIRETNITGYSKLNKKQIIDKMMKEDKRFMDYVLKSHKQQQKETAKKEVKTTPVKKLKPKGTHKMADGTVMSGAVHSKDSKPVKKKIKLTVTKADGTVKELKMKEKKPSARELTDKALEKAKARGAKVVRAEPKKEKVKKFKPLGQYEEIVKQKPRQNLYISSKKDDDDFARLFASLK